MKKGQIVALIVIALCVGFIVSTLSDSSTYAGFGEAFAQPGEEFHVVGEWVKNTEVGYDPSINPNITKFQMRDNNGVIKNVVLYKAKPQDFERSESLVLIGEAKENNQFHAREILMKCPSKYNERNQISAK